MREVVERKVFFGFTYEYMIIKKYWRRSNAYETKIHANDEN